MVASSTRAVVTPSIKSLALFHYLLPSLTTSLDCGFRYIFLLGYDEGDVFYDSTKGMNKTLAWFENKVRLPMQKRNILLTIATVKVANHERKPGPVFNALGQEAYNLGADFMYRVNDDSYLQGNWPAFFVQRLMSLPPPYGVIGPSSVQTDDRILTHDFVHRTHLELFKLDYYPHQLSDWWMDDWISHVYGRQRTFITAPAPYSDISVVHYVHKHPRRYHIDYKHEKLLPQLVLDGQRDIFQWMIEHKRPLAELNAYRESCVQYGEKQSDGTPRALLNLALKKDLQPLPEKLAGDGLTPRSIH